MTSPFSPGRAATFADLALELSTLHCLVLSTDGAVIFASAAVASTTCRRAPEIAGIAFEELVDPDDHTEAARLIATARAGGRVAVAALALRAHDGTLHVIEFTARRLDDEILLVGEPLSSRAAKSNHATSSYWHLRRADDVLPVCMDCHEVRPGDKWVDIQMFLRSNNLPLSHGLCPECFDVRQRGLDGLADTDEHGTRV